MRRRERSRKYQILAIMVIGLWLPCEVMAADIDVFVGYADSIRPSIFFPAPWLGDPGILDVGHAAQNSPNGFDAGAIRIDNNTGAALTVDNVTVDGFANGASFSLWGSFTIPSGMKAILTQTNGENFDTSDQTSRACCTPLGNGVEPFPKVRITIGGNTVVFGDSAHVLDTKGFDIVDLPPGETNESFRWRRIGTTGGQGDVTQPTANDFDGDGKTDILWRHSTTGQVYIWLMDGLAGKSQGSLGQVELGWQIVEVSDFNGDGKVDILWRHSTTGQVYIWFMDGLASQGEGSLGQVELGWQIVKVGDFNGDGKVDILWRHSTTGQVYIWFMDGLASQGRAPWARSSWAGRSEVGDFNGDGKVDILWRHSTTGQVYIWLMDGLASQGEGSLARSSWAGDRGGRRFQWGWESGHSVAPQHHRAGLYLAHGRAGEAKARAPWAR